MIDVVRTESKPQAARKRNEGEDRPPKASRKRSLWLLLGAALVAAAVLIYVFVIDSDDEGGGSAAERSGNAATGFEGGPAEVLYVSGTSLVRYDLDASAEEVVEELKSTIYAVSPGSTWIANVLTAEPNDAPAYPEIHLYDAATQTSEKIGPGYAPVFSADGQRLAYLRPIDLDTCDGQVCFDELEVIAFDPATGEEQVLEEGRWNILDWAGDQVLVSEEADPRQLSLLSTTGDEVTSFRIEPGEILDVSPDGRWLLNVSNGLVTFYSLEGAGTGSEEVEVPARGRIVTAVAWSPTSSTVIALTSPGGDQSSALVQGESSGSKGRPRRPEPSKPKNSPVIIPVTNLVSFSPEEPKPLTLGESEAAEAPILWSPDESHILFPKLVDPTQGIRQAAYCALGAALECQTYFSWTTGVTLLRME